MTNVTEFWRDNRDTFGGGGERWTNNQVTSYYCFVCFLSVTCGMLCSRPTENFFIGVITAVSIVAGFTFNALMFFVDHRFTVQSDKDSLEQASKQRKIDRLAKSSFTILYYFSVSSIGVVICCTIALLMPSLSSRIPDGISKWFWVTEGLGRTILFVVMFEAGVTFLRVLRRLRYLFIQVRAVQ